MRERKWRLVFLIGAIGVTATAVLVMRGGLRRDALLTAVRENDVAAVKDILAEEPDLVTTPVMPQGSRSSIGFTGSIRWQGRTLMHQTVSLGGGSVEMADTLLAFGADLHGRMGGDTLLHFAAKYGDIPMMTWLLDKGADVNARNGCEHPANAVCTSGEFANLQPSSRPDESRTRCTGCEHEGQTPLHAAQRVQAEAGGTLLLSRGADVHATDAAGRTALHFAAEAGTGDGARVLCAYGADPSHRDRNGRTPQDVAEAADRADPNSRFSQTGPGELAGWLQPGGGCARIAARARPGTPVPMEGMNTAWRAYACTRDPKWCPQ